jgi:hypothetical protein
MKGSREDAETRRRSWVRLPVPLRRDCLQFEAKMLSAVKAAIIPPRPLFPLDVRARLRDVHSSKPAEPLGPFGDMTLNSGGFFLPGCRLVATGRSRV